MSDIRIKVDLVSLAHVRSKLRHDEQQLRLAMSKAINDTAKHVKSAMSRLVRNYVAVAKKRIDQMITLERSTPERLRADVTISDEGKRGPVKLPLRLFRPKKSPAGVTVQIQKGGPRELVEQALPKYAGGQRAFISKELYGGVFRRVGRKRLPIEKLYGPNPLDEYAKHNLGAILEADGDRYLHKRMLYRLGVALGNSGDIQ